MRQAMSLGQRPQPLSTGSHPAMVTPALPPDFFDDDFKTVTKLILKTSMTSFQLCEDINDTIHTHREVSSDASTMMLMQSK